MVTHETRNTLFSKVAKFCCVLVAVGLMNIHLGLYQCYAWVSMLNDRIPDQGIEAAFTSTFSGDHPCEKCNAIAKQRSEEHQKYIIKLEIGPKMPLICSLFIKQKVSLKAGRKCSFEMAEYLPLEGILLPVFGPPPQFL